MTVTTGIPSAQHVSSQRLMERLFHGATFGAACIVLLLLGGVAIVLFKGAAPALGHFGLQFFWTSGWNPVTVKFGGWPALYGTLVTSAIAMLLAVPFAFGIAIFLTELAPSWLKRPVGTAVELLAAVPSIIYGIWGFAVLAPIMHHSIQPWLIRTAAPLRDLSSDNAFLNNLEAVPRWLGSLFKGPAYGNGILTAGVVLAIMILPFITAVMRDVFETVPDVLKESAYGLGATTWEVIWKVVAPYTSTGLVGGIMLGLGRALGETMAVTFIIGNFARVTGSVLSTGTTISAAIASEFAEAPGDIYKSALMGLGVMLFIITFLVIAAARLMLLRLSMRSGAAA
jgi:phosphate transport system permease protein